MDQKILSLYTSLLGFIESLLLPRFDTPVPIAEFHKEIWKLCLSGTRRIAIASPRLHAKSTAITHSLTLFLFLFRLKKYGIIVSDTEGQASQFLGDIKTELTENLALIDLFGIKRIARDAITDIVVEFDDGYQFRLQALGAEQKVRGRKWKNTRPDYIVCDDIENDEAVESDPRRKKFRSWFFKALVPALSKSGMIIIVGTILHMDSVLMRLMKNKSWESRFYKAHASFNDFSNILWKEQWSEEELRIVRQEYINDGMSEGYAQEYLNDPLDQSEAFFRLSDFLEMEENHYKSIKNYYAGMDFAISDSDQADYTAIVVGGMDSFGQLHIVDVLRFRGDMDEILNNMLAMQQRYNIDMWKAEEGVIKKTLFGELQRRMIEKNVILNISPGVPTKDKRTRARPLQARMRAGGIRFDKKAEWYPDFEQELLHFPKGQKKDQVDALSWMCIALAELNEASTQSQLDEEKYQSDVETTGESIGTYQGNWMQ